MRRTSTTRRLSLVAAPLLLALSLTACGGDDASDTPDDASKADFCGAFNFEPDIDASFAQLSEDEQLKKFREEFDKYTDGLADTGTPEDIPDDAREGFELALAAAQDVSDDDLRKSLQEDGEDPFEDAFDDDEKKKVEAFDDWSSDYCDDEAEN